MAAMAFLITARQAWAETKSVPYVWKNVTIEGGGFVSGMLMHPKEEGLEYIRTDIGGAYRRDRHSNLWIPLTDWVGRVDRNFLGCESVAIDPSDTERVYLALGTYVSPWSGNGAIARSTDRGASFTLTKMPFKMGGNETGRTAGERLIVDPRDGHILFFGSRTAGLWKSEDHGATWNKVQSFPEAAEKASRLGISFLLFDTNAATEAIYAGVGATGQNLFRSLDGGTSWTAVEGAPSQYLPLHGVMAKNGLLYLSYGKPQGPEAMDDGAVWRLNTHDGKWTNITPIHPTAESRFGYGGIAVAASDPRIVMATTFCRWGAGDAIFRSVDGGATWIQQDVRNPQPTVAIFDGATAPYANGITPHWMSTIAIDPFDSDHVTFVTGFGLWTTRHAETMERHQPTHWFFDNRGLEEIASMALKSPPVGAPLVSAIGDYDGFRHLDLDHATQRHQPSVGTTPGLDFAEDSPNLFIRGGENGKGFWSDDGAATWTRFATKPAVEKRSAAMALSATGASIAWTFDDAGTFYSHDRGTTWQPCAGIAENASVISDRGPTPHAGMKNDCFYALDRAGTLSRSEDGAAHFLVVHEHLPSGRLVASPTAVGDLWLAAKDKGLLHSTDGGSTFVTLAGLDRCSSVGFGKAAPSQSAPTIYVVGRSGNVTGILRSDDQAKTWVRIDDDAHPYGGLADEVCGDPRVFGRVYVGTNGRGIFYATPR